MRIGTVRRRGRGPRRGHAAPGLLVGRGLNYPSWDELYRNFQGRVRSPGGENWNTHTDDDGVVKVVVLRPALGSGEDWNVDVTKRAHRALGYVWPSGRTREWNTHIPCAANGVNRTFVGSVRDNPIDQAGNSRCRALCARSTFPTMPALPSSASSTGYEGFRYRRPFRGRFFVEGR